jgi:hypothetical protein
MGRLFALFALFAHASDVSAVSRLGDQVMMVLFWLSPEQSSD